MNIGLYITFILSLIIGYIGETLYQNYVSDKTMEDIKENFSDEK